MRRSTRRRKRVRSRNRTTLRVSSDDKVGLVQLKLWQELGDVAAARGGGAAGGACAPSFSLFAADGALLPKAKTLEACGVKAGATLYVRVAEDASPWAFDELMSYAGEGSGARADGPAYHGNGFLGSALLSSFGAAGAGAAAAAAGPDGARGDGAGGAGGAGEAPPRKAAKGGGAGARGRRLGGRAARQLVAMGFDEASAAEGRARPAATSSGRRAAVRVASRTRRAVLEYS